jgi:hypothetical protein
MRLIDQRSEPGRGSNHRFHRFTQMSAGRVWREPWTTGMEQVDAPHPFTLLLAETDVEPAQANSIITAGTAPVTPP